MNNEYQNTFENNNKQFFNSTNNFSKPFINNDDKPNFDITESKQFFGQNEVNRILVAQEKTAGSGYTSSVVNLEKKNFEKPSLTNKNFFNNVKQHKFNESILCIMFRLQKKHFKRGKK